MTLSPLSGSTPSSTSIGGAASRLRFRQAPPIANRASSPQADAVQAWTPAALSPSSSAINASRPQPAASATREASSPLAANSAFSGPPETVFQEVNALAEQLGYVGLTRSALARAMAQGGSLLADYRA